MKIEVEMSPEVAALVRKMYENGELDDIVESMVRVEEPVADVADNETDERARAAAPYDKLIAAIEAEYPSGSIHYGVAGTISLNRLSVFLPFAYQVHVHHGVLEGHVYLHDADTHPQIPEGDRVKVKVISYDTSYGLRLALPDEGLGY